MSQRRRNQALWYEVQANLYFLTTQALPIIERYPTSLPFDYASVRVLFGNIHFCFTQGRGELNVTLAPRHDPSLGSELSLVVAALDSSRLKPVNDFETVASILRPRLDRLNEVFSEASYQDFVKKLP